MRNQFIEGLINQAQTDPKIVLLVGDIGYSVVEKFQSRFPERFFNCGIAEQMMMGLAAGLASEGYKVFVYSIANFPTFRCAEQIRNDVAYHNFDVTVVSVGGGVAYGAAGFSHHATQDFALMRAMPNMTILSPGNSQELKHCLEYAFSNSGPKYLRLANTQLLNDTYSGKETMFGKTFFIGGESKSNKIILTTGGTLDISTEWLSHPNYFGFALFSLPIWGNDHKQTNLSQFVQLDEIVTVEDHVIDGGFGSWLLESLSCQEMSEVIPKVTIKAFPNKPLRYSGSQKELRKDMGLIP